MLLYPQRPYPSPSLKANLPQDTTLHGFSILAGFELIVTQVKFAADASLSLAAAHLEARTIVVE